MDRVRSGSRLDRKLSHSRAYPPVSALSAVEILMNSIIRHVGGHRWNGVPVLNYKEEGSHFKAISRQVLFEGGPKLGAELRYFEIEPGGHSTLERHDHIHSVMIIRGAVHCLVGEAVYPIGVNDLVYVPTMTWHQFRATGD